MKLNEITSTNKSEPSIQEFCKANNIKDYTIDKDGLINVPGNVILRNLSIKALPVPFGRVEGSVQLENCYNLKTLENFPHYVGDHFNIGFSSHLRTLTGGPKIVKGYYNCEHSMIESLEGIATEIGALSLTSSTQLKNLKGLEHTIIHHSLTMEHCTGLTSLEGMPRELGGMLNCFGCINLTSLDFLPKKVNGRLLFDRCKKIKDVLKLFSVKGLPLEDKRYLVSLDDPKVTDIVNKWLRKRDPVSCQDELIDSGLEEYAE